MDMNKEKLELNITDKHYVCAFVCVCVGVCMCLCVTLRL